MPNRTSKTNKTWFQDRLKSLGVTQKRLAAALQLDASGVSLLLSGKRRMKAEEAAEIARLLAVPLEDVLMNAGIDLEDAESTTSITIHGWFDTSLALIEEPPKGPKKAPAPLAGARDLKVARLLTAGSPYESLDGALVYYKANRSVDMDSFGRLSVVKIQGELARKLRIVKKGFSPGLSNLYMPTGAAAEENVILEAATPVIWLKV